ncbi:MAG: hypothetical protein LM573_00555 [Thermofilum sp.]|nr:hypothetical protein [Thermofilum sp.]
MGIASLLELDLKKILDLIERKYSIKLPKKVIEVYLDDTHDLLFVRFKEPQGIEAGEPLPTRTIATIFIEDRTGEITALEIVGLSDLLEELAIA